MRKHSIALLLLVCTLFLAWQSTGLSASAGSTGYAFDSTDVMEDLNSSELNGDKFNVVKYTFHDSQQPSILNFVEFGYSFRANMRDNYALYLYVYNPGALRIKETAGQNKVQMAVAYDADGNPSRYEKFSLVFCSASTGDYKGLFYKFRIADRKIDGKSLAERVLSGERRYDVSGFELVSGNNRNATEYKVGGSYRFTGYAAGLGPDKDAPDTLTCHVTELETLALDVRHTYFRTNVSSLGKDHYNEVNTVWFSVPEYIYEEYGYLQKIRAEWWEYKTKYMTVTSNKAFYDALLPYVGTDVGDYSSSVPVSLGYGYLGKNTAGGPTIHQFAWTYNMDTSTRYNALGAITAVYYVDEKQSIMPYAFYAPVSDVSSVFDFLSSGSVAGDISGTVLADWIYNYKNSLGHGYIDCNDRKISRDLFLDRVDDGRTMGYNDRTIDLKDTFDLKSYDSNHNWWNRLWDYGFSWPKTDGDYRNISPIYEVQDTDFVGSDEEISARLLVNRGDVGELKRYYEAERKRDRRVVLFRFASTDYFCGIASPTGATVNPDTYVAQETVFLDFDIIELTFNRNGSQWVIPVVSSPQDFINSITAPQKETQWWKIVLAIVLLILLLVLLMPVLPTIIQIVVSVILLPFRLVRRVIRSIRKKKDQS